MIVAIPADEDGSRFDHFGFCDHFSIVEVSGEGQDAAASECAVVPNPTKGPKGGAARVAAFQEKGVEAVVTDHMGAPMFSKLGDAGIPVYLDRDLLAPCEAAKQAVAGSLPLMTVDDLG